MKVFVVTDDDWEDSLLVGVYTSRKRAEKEINYRLNVRKVTTGHYGMNITEVTLNKQW